MQSRPWFTAARSDDPATVERVLRAAHDAFVCSGAPTAGVRPLVVDSWRRSRELGVDPDLLAPRLELDVDDGIAYAREQPICHAIPALRRLLVDALVPDGMVVVLADHRGRLLWVDGDPTARSALADVGLVAGTNWAESATGTTAPGIALAVGREVQINGPEHYARPIHPWSCTAAPVHDPVDGRLVGVLDITGGPQAAAPHMLGLIRAAVAAIEWELVHAVTSADPCRPELLVLGLRRGRRRYGTLVQELSLRHSEILLALAAAPDGLGAAELAVRIYPDDPAEVTVRAEVSRLRRAVAGLLADGRPYRLRRGVRTDVDVVRAALDAGETAAAVAAYRGPVLPASSAPWVEQVRDDLADDVRAAVLTSTDPDTIGGWACGEGRDDWQAWRRLARVASPGSVWATRAAARLGVLDTHLAVRR